MKMIMMLLFVATATMFSQSKIGYVDIVTIQNGYTEYSKLEAEMKKIQKKYEDQAKKLEEDYRRLGSDYQSQRLLLTQAKQEEKMREIKLKEQEIARFRQEKIAQPNGEVFRKMGEAQKPYLDKVQKAIEQVSKDKGLDLMLNNAQGLVLYAGDKIDYSADVVTILNKK